VNSHCPLFVGVENVRSVEPNRRESFFVLDVVEIDMANFDVLVVGGGTGDNVAAAPADSGLETTLVEPGPLGGTCLSRSTL
jgi:heterodisulfide reductase subunit A-like polyferredoxin